MTLPDATAQEFVPFVTHRRSPSSPRPCDRGASTSAPQTVRKPAAKPIADATGAPAAVEPSGTKTAKKNTASKKTAEPAKNAAKKTGTRKTAKDPNEQADLWTKDDG